MLVEDWKDNERRVACKCFSCNYWYVLLRILFKSSNFITGYLWPGSICWCYFGCDLLVVFLQIWFRYLHFQSDRLPHRWSQLWTSIRNITCKGTTELLRCLLCIIQNKKPHIRLAMHTEVAWELLVCAWACLCCDTLMLFFEIYCMFEETFQPIQVCSDSLTMESVGHMMDMPYSDSFRIEWLWRVKQLAQDENKSVLTVRVGCHFHKHTMMKGTVARVVLCCCHIVNTVSHCNNSQDNVICSYWMPRIVSKDAAVHHRNYPWKASRPVPHEKSQQCGGYCRGARERTAREEAAKQSPSCFYCHLVSLSPDRLGGGGYCKRADVCLAVCSVSLAQAVAFVSAEPSEWSDWLTTMAIPQFCDFSFQEY